MTSGNGLLRAASVLYLGIGGLFGVLLIALPLMTDRGVLGWTIMIPAALAAACLGMGAWSIYLARRGKPPPHVYGACALAIAAIVGAYGTTLLLLATLAPALFAAAATWARKR